MPTSWNATENPLFSCFSAVLRRSFSALLAPFAVRQLLPLDHVVLEDADRAGHRADLVGARHAGQLGRRVALGEARHCGFE
ncbi:MAG: hypothetical protein WDO24_11210 [Pseudomonadota bacterium]